MAEFFDALRTSFMDTFGEIIHIGGGTLLTLNIVVWSIFLGFLIGIGATIYNKAILGAFVRSIIEKKLHTEASAATLSELGHTNIFIKFALRRGSTFRRVVRMSGEETETDGKPTDSSRYYIPEEALPRAEKIYGSLGVSILTILVSILAFLAVSLVALLVIPNLTTLFSNFVSEFASGGNSY